MHCYGLTWRPAPAAREPGQAPPVSLRTGSTTLRLGSVGRRKCNRANALLRCIRAPPICQQMAIRLTCKRRARPWADTIGQTFAREKIDGERFEIDTEKSAARAQDRPDVSATCRAWPRTPRRFSQGLSAVSTTMVRRYGRAARGCSARRCLVPSRPRLHCRLASPSHDRPACFGGALNGRISGPSPTDLRRPCNPARRRSWRTCLRQAQGICRCPGQSARLSVAHVYLPAPRAFLAARVRCLSCRCGLSFQSKKP
jgi:hypothetical protein